MKKCQNDIKMELASMLAGDVGWATEGINAYFYKVSPDQEDLEVIVWSHPPAAFVDSIEHQTGFKWYQIEIYKSLLTDSISELTIETKTTLKFYYEFESEDGETNAKISSHEKYLELCMNEKLNTNKVKEM